MMVTVHPRRHATILVGQSSLLMEGLARLLDNTEFQVIARAPSVDGLTLKDLQEHKTILLILDADGGVESAMRQMEAFKQLHADPRIAVVTRGRRMADMALLFRAGANACFGEGTNVAIFLKSLELVMLGQTLLHANMLSSTSEVEGRTPAPVSGAPAHLSARELHILRSLAEGQPNKTIAREIGTAESTVKVHVKNIFRKIGVANRTQAAMWARSRGIAKGLLINN
jgi:two-component system nitrate/nitrite response regulator NarL